MRETLAVRWPIEGSGAMPKPIKRGDFVTITSEATARWKQTGQVTEVRPGHALPIKVRFADGITVGYTEQELSR